MRLHILLLLAGTVCMVTSTINIPRTILQIPHKKRGQGIRKEPIGRRLDQSVVELHRKKGPIPHDKNGVTPIPHGTHKPVAHKDLPQTRLTVFHQHEIPSRFVNPPTPVYHGCHYNTIGHWDTATTDPIKFLVDPTGSGMTAEQVIDVFDSAASIIKQAVPSLKRPLLFTHLPHGGPSSNSRVPSSRKAHGQCVTPGTPQCEPRKMDKVNEISFTETGAHHSFGCIVSEAYLWYDKDTKEIKEFDMIFSTNSTMAWHYVTGVAGEPNHWDIVHGSSHFDALSAALWGLGHALGLGHSDAHTHTMHAPLARGSFHKRSLECGDVNGLKAIYGR